MKKNFSLKFVSLAMAAALLAAPGCKDYKDDIEKQNSEISALKNQLQELKKSNEAAAKDVASKLEALDKLAKEAKEKAEAAATAAAKDPVDKVARDAAEKAQKAAEAAQTAADEAKATAAQLTKDLKALQDKIAELETTAVKRADLEKAIEDLTEKQDGLMKEVYKFVGNVLTSISLRPTTHVNGIAAIDFLSATYKPQVFNADHRPFGFVTEELGGADPMVVAGLEQEFIFTVSPRAIAEESVDFPFIESWVSENRLRAVSEAATGKNTPIMPVKGQTIKFEDGVVRVKFTKTVDSSLRPEGAWFTYGFGLDEYYRKPTLPIPIATAAPVPVPGYEKFYMASLSFPIADKYITAQQKEAGIKPVVTSEGFRIEEGFISPVIKSKIAKDEDYGFIELGTGEKRDNDPMHHSDYYFEYQPYAYDNTNSESHTDVQINGKTYTFGLPTHFSDSTLLYSSKLKKLVDKDLVWSETYDLMDFVAVSTRQSHATIDYKNYGLEFRFAIAKAPYMAGSLETDQQKFADLKGSMLSSRVYTIGGATQTAVGREPIIRVSLVHKASGNVIDQRYMKFRWIKEINTQPIGTSVFADEDVSCLSSDFETTTQAMNEEIYRQVEKKHGISKTAFHKRYKKIEIQEVKKDGVVLYKKGADMSFYNELAKTEPYSHQLKYFQTKNGWVVSTPDESTERPDVTLPVWDKDIAAYFVPDAQAGDANVSYHIYWVLSPRFINAINGNKAALEMTIKFIDEDQELDLTHVLKSNVVIPSQEFKYQTTYWKGEELGKIFNLNPINYNRFTNGLTAREIDPDNSIFSYGETNEVVEGDSHIQADLVNGFLYNHKNGGLGAIQNLNQLIQKIRKCARVSFQFDETKFGEAGYEHLKGYKVANLGTTLWSEKPAEIKTFGVDHRTPPVVADNYGGEDYKYDYATDHDHLAASISNYLSVSKKENKNKETTFPYELSEDIKNFNPTFVGGDEAKANAARAIIRLHERKASVTDEVAKEGTPAAIALIDKIVPVSLVVEYNKYNPVRVHNFDVFIINPLKVSGGEFGNLVDAVDGGSYTAVTKDTWRYTAWNGTTVSKGATYEHMWKFYAVQPVVYNVKEVKTNLKDGENGTVLVPGYKEGKLPTEYSLYQVKVTNSNTTPWKHEVVESDPTHLWFKNNSGTPLNKDLELYVPVSAKYKWGITTDLKKVVVKPNAGTPTALRRR